MSENNQKNQQSEPNIGWLPRIVTIIVTTIVIVIGMNFFVPIVGEEYHQFCGCYSMSQNDFMEILGAIIDQMLGKAPDTTSLTHILLTEGPERYHGAKFQSFAAEIETCGFCDNQTESVYLFLKAVYELFFAVNMLKLWKSPYIIGIFLIVSGILLVLQKI